MEASQDCIKVTDLTGNLMLMSENGLRITGIDNLMPFIGQPWASLWPPEAASIVNQAVAMAAAGDIARFTRFCPTAKGTPKWWNVTVSPVFDAEHHPEFLLVISRDISERVAADAASKKPMDLLTNRARRRGPTAEPFRQIAHECARMRKGMKRQGRACLSRSSNIPVVSSSIDDENGGEQDSAVDGATPPRTPVFACCPSRKVSGFFRNGAKMPKETHTKAAEHHENAAKAHRTAAEHHGKGEHDKGHEESTKAHEHSPAAHRHSTDAHGKSGEHRTKK